MKKLIMISLTVFLAGCCDKSNPAAKSEARAFSQPSSQSESCQSQCARTAAKGENDTFKAMQDDVNATHAHLQAGYQSLIGK